MSPCVENYLRFLAKEMTWLMCDMCNVYLSDVKWYVYVKRWNYVICYVREMMFTKGVSQKGFLKIFLSLLTYVFKSHLSGSKRSSVGEKAAKTF